MALSTGGPSALIEVLSRLPGTFPIPIVIVQHMPQTFTRFLAERLNQHTPLTVVEAEDKMPIESGTVYLAPADYHLLVEYGEFDLSVDAAVAFSRPSIDVMFESAADAYREHLIGVVLTGANADGARGAQRIKQRGGLVIVQDPATAEAPSMPRAAIEQATVDRILPLERIGPYLIELCRNSLPLSVPSRT
jgi:two-component system chemotaxis response regulator CheB